MANDNENNPQNEPRDVWTFLDEAIGRYPEWYTDAQMQSRVRAFLKYWRAQYDKEEKQRTRRRRQPKQ